MKTVAPISLVALLASSAVAVAIEAPSYAAGVSHVHARLHASRAQMRRESGGQMYKRCKPKYTGSPSATPDSTPAPAPAPAPENPEPAPAASPAPVTIPEPAPEPSPEPAPAAKTSGGSGDLIKVKSNGCGDVGATSDVTKTSGPNGSQDFLNCGVNTGGWRPPYITVGDLRYKDLGAELASGNSIFKNCAQYSDAIYGASGETGLPPIMIASIMMQESSCNKDTVGGGGEQGLMQITHEKCAGAPGGNCRDPWFNIHTGARYLKGQVDANGGNVLKAIGSYNGWVDGMTIDSATAARWSACCRCQNNLDYLHQFLNGWLQGKDAYSNGLGVYNNLAVCGAY
ncbi:Transglycosylase SLT domain, partial [Rhizoctonia solani]